jgi:Prokaryotic dksA/traR C4-type zinc finger
MSAKALVWLHEGRFVAPLGQFCLLWHQAPARRRRMNRNLVAQARKQLLRRGRALLRAAAKTGNGAAAPTDALGAIGDAELTELQEIHAALERIERGIFGRCEDCQADIEADRVETLPWERRCAACRGDAAESHAARAGAQSHASAWTSAD